MTRERGRGHQEERECGRRTDPGAQFTSCVGEFGERTTKQCALQAQPPRESFPRLNSFTPFAQYLFSGPDSLMHCVKILSHTGPVPTPPYRFNKEAGSGQTLTGQRRTSPATQCGFPNCAWRERPGTTGGTEVAFSPLKRGWF